MLSVCKTGSRVLMGRGDGEGREGEGNGSAGVAVRELFSVSLYECA